MIRPIVIAEYHQTRRNLLKVIIALLLASVILRLTGAGGVLIGGLLVLPSVCLAVGAGTFTEEFSKGHFKFLYAMPVSRFGVWAVKCISGILGITLLSLSVGVPLFCFPDATVLDALEVLKVYDVPWMAVAAVLGALALYAYSVGMFAVTMCVSPIGVSIVGFTLLYLPGVVLAMACVLTGTPPTMIGIGGALIAGALVFLAGSLVLFAVRNPFLERRWLWRGIGSGFVAASAAVLGLGSALAVVQGDAAGAMDLEHVLDAHPSPDGRHLLVVTQRLLQTHGYVLAADGACVARLGPGVVPLGLPELTWRPGTAGVWIAYTVTGRSLAGFRTTARDQSDARLVLQELGTGQTVRLPHLHYTEDDSTYGYARWSPDGQRLVGTRYRYDARSQSTSECLFAQDAAIGEVTETLLHEGDAVHEFLPDSRILLRASDGETDCWGSQIVVFDPSSGMRDAYCLPEDTVSFVLLPHSRTTVLVHKWLEGRTVGFEVIRYDLISTTREVLLQRGALPQADIEQALRQELGHVDVELSPSGRWLMMSIRDAQPGPPEANETRQLMDLTDPCLTVTLPDDAGPGTLAFSPDETRVLAVGWPEPDEQGSDRDPASRTVTARVYQLDSDVPREVYAADLPERWRPFMWWGEDKLIYLLASDRDDSPLDFKRQVWVINLADGTHQPLRAAAESHSIADCDLGIQ